MKNRFLLLSLSALLVAAAGCSKKEPEAAAPAPEKVASNTEPNPPSPDGSQPAVPKVDPPAEPGKPVDPDAPAKEMVEKVKSQATLAQDELRKPIQKSSPDWKATNVKLKELGTKTGAAIANMKGTLGKLKIMVETPAGVGSFEQLIKVRDKNHYNVYFVDVAAEPYSGTVLANGDKKQMRKSMAISEPVPINQPMKETKVKDFTTAWPTRFPRMVFQGLLDRKDAWGPFLDEIASGKGGYKTTVQERNMTFEGKSYRHYRVIAERKADPKKKQSASSIEIVIDANRFLPVTIRSKNVDLDQKKWNIEWNGSYKFNQTFRDSDFTDFEAGKVVTS